MILRRQSLFLAAGAVLTFLSAPAASGTDPQEPLSYLEFVTVRGESQREHRFQAMVKDEKGNPVTGLDLSDFLVTVKGEECVDGRDLADLFSRDTEEARERLQAIARSGCDVSYFAGPEENRERPKVIAVVVDISGSVAKRERDGTIHMERLVEIAGYVREGLQEIFDPEDEYIFARFSSVMYEEGPTRDPDTLVRILLRPYKKGWGAGTPYYATVQVITDRLKLFRENPKAILMFSDCVPYDRVQADLDSVAKEVNQATSIPVQWELRRLKRRLLQEKVRMMETALDYTLEVGVPVYNVHYPGENYPEAAKLKAECHRWVLRTGGTIFYMGRPEADIKDILEEVRRDTDSVYLFDVRHDKPRAVPRLQVKGHRKWKVVYPREFQSFESSTTTVVYRLVQGTPGERLEAAYFARRFGTDEVRDALRGQVGREFYEEVRETVIDSLLAICLPEICSEERRIRRRALEDVNILYPELDPVQKHALLDREPENCNRFPEFREAILHWWGEEKDPGFRALLYAANIEAVRFELENQLVSRALRRAEDLQGREVVRVLEEYLDAEDLDGKARGKIRTTLRNLKNR